MSSNEMIEWANANQGFGLITLTAIYVIATIAIVLVTLRSNMLMKRQMILMRDLEKERARPVVLFHLEFAKREDQIVDVVFHNIGRTAAYDVKATIEPELRRFWSGGISDTSPTALAFSFIPPGEKIIDSLGFINVFHREYESPIFSGKIRYKDSFGAKFCEEVAWDYSYRKIIGVVRKVKMDIGDQLETIAKELSRMNKS